MGLVGNGWANCFRTHNELTMGLSGKYPLAPSVSVTSCIFQTIVATTPPLLSPHPSTV